MPCCGQIGVSTFSLGRLPLQELLVHNPDMKAGHSALELYIMAKRDNKERWHKMADVGRQKWQAQAQGATFHGDKDL